MHNHLSNPTAWICEDIAHAQSISQTMSMIAQLLYTWNTFQSSRYEGVLRIIQRYFFLFLHENISCDPSLEPSQREGSNGGS